MQRLIINTVDYPKQNQYEQKIWNSVIWKRSWNIRYGYCACKAKYRLKCPFFYLSMICCERVGLYVITCMGLLPLSGQSVTFCNSVSKDSYYLRRKNANIINADKICKVANIYEDKKTWLIFKLIYKCTGYVIHNYTVVNWFALMWLFHGKQQSLADAI